VAVAWRRTARLGHPEVFAAIAALSFLAARFLPVLAVPWTCPLRAVAGLPCATCGMTHAFVALAHGEVAAAFGASPLGALLAGGAWLYAALDLVRAALGAPWPDPGERAWRWMAGAAAASVVLNWAWLLARAAS
jgi:uncharacterized protein DUF2752